MATPEESIALYGLCRSASEQDRASGYQALGRTLHAVVWPRVHADPRLHHLAADCTQESLLIVWRKLSAGQGPDQPESFIHWSIIIALNKLREELRALRTSATVGTPLRVPLGKQDRLDQPNERGGSIGDALPDPASADSDRPLRYLDLVHLVQAIRDVTAVSPQSRTVIARGYLAGWDDDELAAHLNVTRANVHLIRCRDLKKLRADSAFMARLGQYRGG